MDYFKRAKEIRALSMDIDKSINIIKSNDCGKYLRDLFDVNSIYDIVNFIDNNFYIKEQLGKSIRLLSKAEYGIEGIEIYDYFEHQQKIDNSIKDFFI